MAEIPADLSAGALAKVSHLSEKTALILTYFYHLAFLVVIRFNARASLARMKKPTAAARLPGPDSLPAYGIRGMVGAVSMAKNSALIMLSWSTPPAAGASPDTLIFGRLKV